ncbi:MarR family transcriptional regulator [Patescibacteria group bacterium]|nr:MarR family transcriptional regulator [Patescibacteria group bacterium]
MKKHASRDVEQAISLFFAVRRIMNTTFARGRKLDPSTWLRIETMKFISEHHKPKMKDIADYLSITAPSATSLVNGLAKSGLVTSCIDRSDRRTSRLMLTRAGKAELASAITRGLKRLGRIFDVLSKKELSAFADALERIKKTAGT